MTRLAVALCFAGLVTCAGQGAGEVLPRAPRELSARLSAARLAVAQGRFSDAAPLVEAVLACPEDGFVPGGAEDEPQRTLKAEAAALLASLPPEGLVHYEAWCGGKARQMLDEAAGRRDRGALARLARQYPATFAGCEAALVLAYDGLDRRNPLEALAWLRRAEQVPAAARPLEPELTLATAVACLMGDRPQQAGEAVARLASLGPRVRFRVGDEEFTARDDPRRVLEALSTAVGPVPPRAAHAGAAWPMFRGSAARNAQSSWSGSVGPLRWKVDVQDKSSGGSRAAAPGIAGPRQGPLVPAAHPLVVGPLVLARTPQRLAAIELAGGRQVWEFPWGGESTPSPSDPRLRSSMASNQAVDAAQRTYDDAPYGQMSSDGRLVFLVDGLFRAGGYAQPVVMMVGGRQVIGYSRPDPHKRLVALALGKEGKLAWSVGAASGEDEPALAGVFFLGPPLVHEGRLYAMYEIDGEVRVGALEAATGRQEWSLAIAAPERPILADPQRRLAGATPSWADGVLVCPTSAGAVVAVDPVDRSILWGREYALAEDAGRVAKLRMARFGVFSGSTKSSASIDATATIAAGRVLLAPVESDDLLCIDLHSGTLHWSRPVDDLLYVACVDGETAMTVGAANVSAWNLRTGKPAWQDLAVELPDGAKTAGRGFLSGRSYHVPTTAPGLVEIEVATGRILKRSSLASTPGNLVALGPLVVSQSAEAIEAFGAEKAAK